MKKRNKQKQDRLHKITTKRALYEKARKQKQKAQKQAATESEVLR